MEFRDSSSVAIVDLDCTVNRKLCEKEGAETFVSYPQEVTEKKKYVLPVEEIALYY